MSRLYIPEQSDNEDLRQNYFNYSKVGLLDVLGTTFQQMIYENPMSSAKRSAELYFKGNSGRKLDALQYAESEYYRPGIEVDTDGIYESAASILADRYDEREARKKVLERSRGGFGTKAAQFGVGLVASALDPLNIAASFIPVMGQARYAAMVARVGKTGARLRSGAAAGAVGAAVVEPLVYGTALYEQNADYTLADTMMNIAFGTVLGGGLHVGAGKISDSLQRVGHKQRLALGRTAVAQAVDGREIELDPLVNASPEMRNDPAFRGETQEPDYEPRVPLIDRPRIGTKLPPILQPGKASAKKPKTLTEFVRGAGGIKADDPLVGDVAQAAGDVKGKTTIAKRKQIVASKARRAKGVVGPEPKSVDDMALAAWEAGYFRGEDRPTTSEFLEALQDDIGGNFKYSDLDLDDLNARQQAEDLKAEADKYGIRYKGMSDEDFLAVLENRREAFGAAEMQRDYKSLTEQEIAEMRAGIYEGLDDTVETREFRARMDEATAEAAEFDADQLGLIDKQNEDLQLDIDAMIEQGADPEDFIAELAEFEALNAKADSYEDIALAAARCLINPSNRGG